MKKALEAFLASGERLAELAGKTLHIDLGVVTDAVIVLLLERGGEPSAAVYEREGAPPYVIEWVTLRSGRVSLQAQRGERAATKAEAAHLRTGPLPAPPTRHARLER